jgi:mono/diheme cytochrome c family protein
MRKVLISVFATLATMMMGGLAVMKLGLVAVNADQTPPALESRVMPIALHASTARHATQQANPNPATEENLKTGVETYRLMCARCHSLPGGDKSVYGSSFYPPAPRLTGGLAQYTEAELFWVIKHGIRNTGMLAWGGMLSDEEIWQIVTLLKRSSDLPPAVEAEWAGKNK